MILSGGNFGGFELIGDEIILEDISYEINLTSKKNEFYIIDNNNIKWIYFIYENTISFTGILED